MQVELDLYGNEAGIYQALPTRIEDRLGLPLNTVRLEANFEYSRLMIDVELTEAQKQQLKGFLGNKLRAIN